MAQFYVVRYGQMRFLGEFQGLDDVTHSRGQNVVIQTERGRELGQILCPASTTTNSYLENPFQGRVLRIATAEDLSGAVGIPAMQEAAFKTCRELIAKRDLKMDLVDVEVILGGERYVFYYLAENRVDFRELVKDLARVFRTRVEMRQIGCRDEAKLLADFGDCGEQVCCNSHLNRMPPVTMRMAKLQKTTLDPSKISGRCGRLKCCLRYEYDTYQEHEANLPQVNSRVMTSRGPGRVIALEILPRKIFVELDDHRRLQLGPSDIQSVLSRGRPEVQHRNEVDISEIDIDPEFPQ